MHRSWLVLTSMVLCLSCISVREHSLSELAPTPAAARAKARKIRIHSKWTVESESLSDVQKQAIARRYRENFEDALNRKDCCEIVDSRDDADLMLRVKSPMESRMTALLFTLLTGATAYIIPSWAREEVDLSGTVQVGEKTFDHHWRDSSTLVQWLPLIFAMPFYGWPDNVSEDMVRNVFEHVATDTLRDYGG